MKKMILFTATCVVTLMAAAQTPAQKKPVAAKPNTAKPAAKAPIKPGVALKNSVDSFSYAIGLSLATFYKQQGITDINNTYVLKALNDVKTGKPLMDDAQANSTIMARMQVMKAAKSGPNRKAGEAFLANNKKRPGVITTASGLQYEIIKEGTGVKPTAEDQVKVHYVGTLINGKEFDSSIKRGEPIVFGVTGVIPGWTEALQLMPTGSKWKLYLPADIAYGDNQAGPDILPGSTLVFEVELLEVVKK